LGTNLLQVMNSPLTQAGQTGPFLRLVLAEAISYGMPPQVAATLDDVAAMLGFYEPLSAGQAAHLAAPVVAWRTDRRQPSLEHISDMEALAMKQRALIAFGGAPPDHMVGTAEIVCAVGNMHKKEMPPEYYDVFAWASTDAMAEVTRQSKDVVRKAHEFPNIFDEEVLRPGGRLHATYTEIATSIRRAAIAAIKSDPDEDPRAQMRPLALYFLEHYNLMLQEGEQTADTRAIAAIGKVLTRIRGMFPDITQAEIDDYVRVRETTTG
jgi:hypothetical protein